MQPHSRLRPPCPSQMVVVLFATMIVFGCLGLSSQATEFLVATANDVNTAMQMAQPGDSVVMVDGTWTNQHIQFAGNGTDGMPITLRAQTPGGVLLNGSSRLSISGDYLVADGLNFEGGALASGNIVEFRGSNGEATNSRLTNSAIVDYNPTSIDTRYFWVSLYGQSNRVDHNLFSGQNHSGVTVTVWRDSPTADLHQIDNNYFADRPQGNDNGFETIRIGTGAEALSDSFTLVENNLFERVDGEIEIISGKSGNNTYRYNTFRESAGTLTLRHGHGSTVEGNFFLGEGKGQSGGVRVIGENHTLINNYFSGLDGRADGAISISAGVPNASLSSYPQVKNALIAHNTIIDVNAAAVTFDDGLGSKGRTLLAEDVTIANNLIWSGQDPLFEGTEGANWTWEGNMAYGQSLGPTTGNPGITIANPHLALGQDGLYRLSSASPAIDAGASGYTGFLSDDIEGQPRIGLYDVGADEFSTAAIVRKPLSAGDVGPDWIFSPPTPSQPGAICLANGCAIQAEAFTSILDPDADGAIWDKLSVPEALGGEVLKAPNGSVVNLTTGEHDTIASFDLEFETPGVYTAYYRARGFSSSTDSLFTPDDFGTDPDNIDYLSSDGEFRWEKDSTTFTITPSHIGVPLEFRLAMRERFVEFDAFVLNLDSNLSDAELDSLFATIAGDYNGNGIVDAADYTVWRNTFGQTGVGLAADGDGSGEIDAADYTFWVNNFGNNAGNATANAVPEPHSMVLMMGLLLSVLQRSTRRNREATS